MGEYYLILFYLEFFKVYVLQKVIYVCNFFKKGSILISELGKYQFCYVSKKNIKIDYYFIYVWKQRK